LCQQILYVKQIFVNNIQHNDTQHNGRVLLKWQCYGEWLSVVYAECYILFILKLNVIMLSVVLLNVVILNVSNNPFMAECHYAECYYAEGYMKNLYAEPLAIYSRHNFTSQTLVNSHLQVRPFRNKNYIFLYKMTCLKYPLTWLTQNF
jgi:hypothetical protein